MYDEEIITLDELEKVIKNLCCQPLCAKFGLFVQV
jgi:hypothetical protein